MAQAAQPVTVAGRVALVTGAGSGLGQAIAVRLGAAGVRVAVHYGSSAQGAAQTVAAVRAAGGEAIAIAADLTDPAAAPRLVEEVTAALGRVEILVNNAATTRFIPFEDLDSADDEVWTALLRVNLLAPVALARATFPAMVDAGWGRVLNVASTSAFEPAGSSLPYAVSKSALVSFTRGLAAVAPAGVAVSAVAPGWMDTPWTARHTGRTDAVVSAEVDVDEVARAAVELIGGTAGNGTVVVLDGGARWRRLQQGG
ncbi:MULTISPECIES: SDR family NAD(P)-dependent oxidoreductase [Micromonospora]|uniref:Beta-ketoacyl-ACP reductase n=1 Tax=Micromonospora lutea TaxID=419825 RepID=A0ABQ4J1K7_9ACTN|nr:MULTISPECIES: SDR family oxidoreductase [Micromonospora]MTK05221.1 SDR family oxidoreductase [Micromonospora sp. CP22]GIJ23898.1 beta-ketoacyl-ACP reductase [Micromonospora lutea]